MTKTAPLADIRFKYVELTCIGKISTEFRGLSVFRGSATARSFGSPARRGGNSGFSFSGSCELLIALSSIESSPQIQE